MGKIVNMPFHPPRPRYHVLCDKREKKKCKITICCDIRLKLISFLKEIVFILNHGPCENILSNSQPIILKYSAPDFLNVL